MNENNLSYIRYDDNVEVKQPLEDEQSREVVESMASVNRLMFDKLRHAVRDAHAKSHGILRGDLEIYPDLSQHCAGNFSESAKISCHYTLLDRPRNNYARWSSHSRLLLF